MLRTRILTALVLVPLLLAALFLLPPRAWGVATLAVIGIAAYEWARLTGFAPSQWTAVVGEEPTDSPAGGEPAGRELTCGTTSRLQELSRERDAARPR